MITKPNDWTSAQAEVGAQKRNRLPLGNYICKIVAAAPHVSKAGNETLKIAWDIAEGPYTDFYLEKFGEAQAVNPSAKWKNCATHYIPVSNAGKLKGLAKCLEQSNPGYTWDFDEKKLAGLKFAGQMAGEEKEYNGHKYTEVSLAYIYPVDEFDSMGDAFMRKAKAEDSSGFGDMSGFGEASDEQIPF